MAIRLFYRDPFEVVDPTPSWNDFGSSLMNLERGMRHMDRQYNDIYDTFLRLVPSQDYGESSETQRARRGGGQRQRSCDVGFPDALVQNPIITDKEGKRHLALRFDVRQFKPEEIKIRTYDDNKLEVSAKHETSDDNHRVYREYHRMCTLPEGLDVNTLKSQVYPDGVLAIEAPLPAIEPPKKKEKLEPARNEPVPVAIAHEK